LVGHISAALIVDKSKKHAIRGAARTYLDSLGCRFALLQQV